MKDEIFTSCAECGMRLISMAEYHPYAACVMYRQTKQAEKVTDMLREIGVYFQKAAKNGVSVDVALRSILAATEKAGEA